MSKSRGNVVNPDELVQKYGADTVRAYLMFGFDWAKGGPWDESQIIGVVRWLNDVWALANQDYYSIDTTNNQRIKNKLKQTIYKVTQGLEKFSFNICIAALMELRNDLKTYMHMYTINTSTYKEVINTYIRLMSPFVPHIAEELWEIIGETYSVHQQEWPDVEDAIEVNEVALIVSVNGKVKSSGKADAKFMNETYEAELIEQALVDIESLNLTIVKTYVIRNSERNMISVNFVTPK